MLFEKCNNLENPDLNYVIFIIPRNVFQNNFSSSFFGGVKIVGRNQWKFSSLVFLFFSKYLCIPFTHNVQTHHVIILTVHVHVYKEIKSAKNQILIIIEISHVWSSVCRSIHVVFMSMLQCDTHQWNHRVTNELCGPETEDRGTSRDRCVINFYCIAITRNFNICNKSQR